MRHHIPYYDIFQQVTRGYLNQSQVSRYEIVEDHSGYWLYAQLPGNTQIYPIASRPYKDHTRAVDALVELLQGNYEGR